MEREEAKRMDSQAQLLDKVVDEIGSVVRSEKSKAQIGKELQAIRNGIDAKR